MNRLYYGDNLTIMQQMPKHSVDLIYLDPPFNSKQNYNLMYKTMTGKPVPEQVEAFCDTWEMDAHKREIAKAMPSLMRDHGVDGYYVQFWDLWMRALEHTQPHLLAYLIYMVQRLLHMKSILRPTGSIFLHCDPTASHYIKVMMDGIFGHNNFRNEIIWKRTSAHSSAKRFGPVHDTILFYSASENYKWRPVFEPYDKSYIDAFYTHVDEDGARWQRSDLTGAGTRNGATGESWRGIDITAKGRHWAYPPTELDRLDAEGKVHWPAKAGGMPRLKRYLKEQAGMPAQDVITDIQPMHNLAKERLGYPTQKPIALLDRIIRSASDRGDVVFDPFCGCGTTIYSAIKNDREWVGCDIAILSIKLIREVLTERHRMTEGKTFEVRGIPVSVEQAHELFTADKFHFQHWLVERAGGFPMQKKVADRGIDGRIYFESSSGLSEMVLSVKGGHLKPADVRDLRGVLEREPTAKLAGFLSLKEPSKAMRREAAEAGQFHYGDRSYDRIQLLTVADILERKLEFRTPVKVNTKLTTGQLSLQL